MNPLRIPMKKLLSTLLLCVTSVLLFTACEAYTGEDGQGKLVINNTVTDTRYIAYVWCKLEDESGYTLYWRNASTSQSACNLYLDAGKYNVIIGVYNPELLINNYEEYQTGYKHPIEIKEGEYSFLCFDGNGIYNPYE